MTGAPMMCGIVLYNPSPERLAESLGAIAPQVERVVLVDNGSDNLHEAGEVVRHHDNAVVIANDENMGIAHALNQIVAYARDGGYEWALTLDQDSVCEPFLIERYRAYLEGLGDAERSSIGALHCDCTYRNGSTYQNRRFGQEPQDVYAEDIEWCITSACLMNVGHTLEIGGFDERLFIDLVDTDVCLRLREAGWRVVALHFYGFLHELGHLKRFYVLGKRVTLLNHSPMRSYYMSRNSVYLRRRDKNPVTRQEIKNTVKRTVWSVLFEDRKAAKLWASVRGCVDGLRMPTESARYL